MLFHISFLCIFQFLLASSTYQINICLCKEYYSCVLLILPDKKAEDRAGSGAEQPDHDVRHDESAGSCHGKTGRHGAAGGKKSDSGFIILCRNSALPLTDLVLFTFLCCTGPLKPLPTHYLSDCVISSYTQYVRKCKTGL